MGEPNRARGLRPVHTPGRASVRLWPTTLAALRATTTRTSWDGGVLPAGTALVIVSSVFHRDERALPYADRFEPEVWLDGRAQSDWPLIPFSGGPGTCAEPDRPLPRTLNHVALRLAVSRSPSGLAT